MPHTIYAIIIGCFNKTARIASKAEPTRSILRSRINFSMYPYFKAFFEKLHEKFYSQDLIIIREHL